MTRVAISVRTGVMTNVWADVRDHVCDHVWRSIGDSVTASVWTAVRDSVWTSLRESVGECVGDSFHGAHDAGWLAFYRYLRDVVGLTGQTERLAGLWELAQSAGWLTPHQNTCWVSERHNILARDNLGRLHSLVGPACAYPDGWSIHAVHGVRVPRYVVERPAEISVSRIDAEPNAEVRRVMIERYRCGEEINGSAAYLRDSGGEAVDRDARFGTLWRRDSGHDEPLVMVEVVNATPEPDGRFKHYWLRVPPQTRTAHEAVAWTFGADTREYAPEIET